MTTSLPFGFLGRGEYAGGRIRRHTNGAPFTAARTRDIYLARELPLLAKGGRTDRMPNRPAGGVLMANDGSRMTYHLTRGPADRSPCDTLQAQSGLISIGKGGAELQARCRVAVNTYIETNHPDRCPTMQPASQ